jgi:hypothetical protein
MRDVLIAVGVRARSRAGAKSTDLSTILFTQEKQISQCGGVAGRDLRHQVYYATPYDVDL